MYAENLCNHLQRFKIPLSFNSWTFSPSHFRNFLERNYPMKNIILILSLCAHKDVGCIKLKWWYFLYFRCTRFPIKPSLSIYYADVNVLFPCSSFIKFAVSRGPVHPPASEFTICNAIAEYESQTRWIGLVQFKQSAYGAQKIIQFQSA